MLAKADILLLDEPTNHLDKANVRWIMEYLSGPECANVTSLIVTHDTKFADEVCWIGGVFVCVARVYCLGYTWIGGVLVYFCRIDNILDIWVLLECLS